MLLHAAAVGIETDTFTAGVSHARAQVWSATAGWQKVAGCSVTPMLTADTDISKRDSHAWLFGWKNATVFQVRRLDSRPSAPAQLLLLLAVESCS